MKKIFRREVLVVETRYMWASILLVGFTIVLLFRIWYLQIFRGEDYKRISENNRIRRIEIPAPRGLIFDAQGKLILGNAPSSDLILIPQFVTDAETTFTVLARLLHVPEDAFHKRYRAAQGQPKFLPIVLQRNLSQHEVAVIESNKIFLPGIDVSVTPRRDYRPGVPSHLVGYLGEIAPTSLAAYNKKVSDNPYQPGDLVGKYGLESRWEEYLRGRRGYRLIQVDASGRQSNLFRTSSWRLPQVGAVPGANIELTVDLELQNTIREAFRGKNGAVIVMDPRSGAILGMSSQPAFDPAMYQRGMTPEEWRVLSADPFHPFLDKTTGGEFPPGSTYKTVVALAGLEEKIITPDTTFFCPGSYTLGSETFGCHIRSGHGLVNLNQAIMKSCDTYFYHVGVELGVDRIAKYARALGLGQKMGFSLNMERRGLVPTMEWKRDTYKEAWAAGETPPVAIGQGYNLMTPMQMAGLYAALATKGKIWRPFVVRRVVSHLGQVLEENQPELWWEAKNISENSFNVVRRGLESVVMDSEGTGKNARVPGVRIAGKTGSVQVVNLKKNHNQSDVSMKWREHAMFASFAPVDDPQVVVVVVSEHDEIGGGGHSAAPVAGKILQKFFELKKQRDGTVIGAQPKGNSEHGDL